MAIGPGAADRVERFLAAHPTGPLVVCVGSASVAGIVWLAQRSRGRRVTLFIGDMKSRNFALATDRDRSAALAFVSRTDVDVRNWYRTKRSSQGRSEAHLKVWASCDDTGAPQAFLVGSANLTIAGLHENIELMALADASEHGYLRSTLQQLQDKSGRRCRATRQLRTCRTSPRCAVKTTRQLRTCRTSPRCAVKTTAFPSIDTSRSTVVDAAASSASFMLSVRFGCAADRCAAH